MTITKLQDKYLAEIDKLRTILDDENIDNNKFYVIKSSINKLLNIEKLELIMQMKKAEGKISDYMNEINNIKNLQTILRKYDFFNRKYSRIIIKTRKAYKVIRYCF